MDSILTTMEDISWEEGECCFCFSNEDLYSLLEPYDCEGNVEIYSTMIAECFQMEFSSYVEEYNKNLYLICKNCVFRLKDTIMLRSQIQIAYDRLQAECSKKDDQCDISRQYSDIMETKEHILKYEISEFDNTEYNINIDSGASVSNENVIKLKPMKIVLDKIDNDMIENVSIISTREHLKKSKNTNSGSDAKSQFSKIYLCNICNKLFRNLPELQKHQSLHFDTNKNKCRFCGKAFLNNSRVIRHEKIHLNIKEYICDYCKRGFRHKYNLQDHILLHMNIKNFKCDVCNKSYVSYSVLSTHYNLYHTFRSSCEICGKVIHSKRSFEIHALTHSRINNHKNYFNIKI